MDLCEACIRLARQVSAGSNHTREVHSVKATDLLVSGQRCRLCKYLTSCLLGLAYSSTSIECHEPDTTVGEWLISHPGFHGPLEFEVFEPLSYCRFYTGSNDEDDEQTFKILFWAEPGMFSSKAHTLAAELPRYCSFHI